MQRLINDAAKLDKTVKANDLSFGNIVKAIHAVQTEMGIAGTTAKEAEETISGSMASMKAAWSDLMTELAKDDGDVESAAERLVDALGTVSGNLEPRIKKTIGGIAKLVEKQAPQLGNALGKGIETGIEMLPQFENIAIGLMDGVMNGIEQNSEGISSAAVQFVDLFVGYMTNLATRATKVGGKILTMTLKGFADKSGGEDGWGAQIGEMVKTIGDEVEAQAPEILENGGEILQNFLSGFDGVDFGQTSGSLVMMLAEGLLTNLPAVVDKATDLIKGFTDGLKDNANREILVSGIRELALSAVDLLVTGIPAIIDIGADVLSALVEGLASALPEAMPKLLEATTGLIETIGRLMQEGVDGMATNNIAVDLIMQLADWLIDSAPVAIPAIVEMVSQMVNYLLSPENIERIVYGAIDLVMALVTGLIDGIPLLLDGAVKLIISFCDALVTPDMIAKILNVAIILLMELTEGLLNSADVLLAGITDLVVKVVDNFVSYDWSSIGGKIIAGVVDGFWDGINDFKNVANKLWQGMWQSFPKWLRNLLGEEEINANVNVNGSHSSGLDYVPYNGYLAELHKGERVLTAKEAEMYNRDGGGKKKLSLRDINVTVQVSGGADGDQIGERVAEELYRILEQEEAVYA